MALFRLHRGGLAESLETVTQVASLNEVQEYCNYPALGWLPTDLECRFYAHDKRMDAWNDTYIITGTIQGQRVVMGFSNEELK